jgi:hypothetical protein
MFRFQAFHKLTIISYVGGTVPDLQAMLVVFVIICVITKIGLFISQEQIVICEKDILLGNVVDGKQNCM